MKPSALTRDAFVARFGPVYEASPWVAEAVWPAAARGALDDAGGDGAGDARGRRRGAARGEGSR